MTLQPMASPIVRLIVFSIFLIILCVTNCVHCYSNDGTTTSIPNGSTSDNLSLKSEGNGTDVDWVQSVLQTYDGDKASKNGTHDMDTSASGHRYRVTHVNPSTSSSYEEDQSSDYRSRASSAYRGSSYHHHHNLGSDGQPLSSHESNDDRGDYGPHKSRPYGHPRDDISSPASLSSREDSSSRKNDPDFGQHYDSDGHRYDFGYDVKDKDGAQAFRKETGDAKSLKGSYGIRDVDGRLRIVRYVADEKGFRAKVETNEPGTGSEDSANVYFNGYDAERIPSHEVTHKDRGQHSFKHGHYNKHSPADSGLYDDHREYVDQSSHDDIAGYRLHDQIPMEIQPAVAPRMRFAPVPLEANMVDTADHDGTAAVAMAGMASMGTSPMDGFRTPFKEIVPPYPTSLHHHIHHHPSSHIDHTPKFARPLYAKRRQDTKGTDFTYNIPYNSITGFFKTRYL